MAISAAAITRLESNLAISVEGFIADGLSDWAQAAEGAINDARDPDEADSEIFWLIALAGNMLWASTVFFAPEVGLFGEAVIGATNATKAASLLGAGLGSDVVHKLHTRQPNPENAKAFLRDVVAARKDELREIYVDAADEWIKRVLAPHVIEDVSGLQWEGRGRPAPEVFDQDLQKVTVHGQAALRDFTVEHFLFPGAPFTAKEQSVGMRNLMVKELQGALLDFNRQYREWRNEVASEADAYQGDEPLDVLAVFPFNPRLKFTGVPASVRMSVPISNFFVFNPVGSVVARWVDVVSSP